MTPMTGISSTRPAKPHLSPIRYSYKKAQTTLVQKRFTGENKRKVFQPFLQKRKWEPSSLDVVVTHKAKIENDALAAGEAMQSGKSTQSGKSEAEIKIQRFRQVQRLKRLKQKPVK